MQQRLPNWSDNDAAEGADVRDGPRRSRHAHNPSGQATRYQQHIFSWPRFHLIESEDYIFNLSKSLLLVGLFYRPLSIFMYNNSAKQKEPVVIFEAVVSQCIPFVFSIPFVSLESQPHEEEEELVRSARCRRLIPLDHYDTCASDIYGIR